MGFEMGLDFADTGGKPSSSRTKQPGANIVRECLLSEERKFAHDAWLLAIQLTKHRALSLSQATHAYLGLFVFLVSPVAADRKNGLELCKRAWLAISAAEERAINDPALSRVLAAVLWLYWVVVREVLIALAQVDWPRVPKVVDLTLRQHFSG